MHYPTIHCCDLCGRIAPCEIAHDLWLAEAFHTSNGKETEIGPICDICAEMATFVTSSDGELEILSISLHLLKRIERFGNGLALSWARRATKRIV